MCVVSMVMDHYYDKVNPFYPEINNPYPKPGQNPQPNLPQPEDWLKDYLNPPVRKKEFDELKRMMEEMKELLIKAKIYDEKNKEPHCEKPELIAALTLIAKAVGVDLKEVFENGK